METLLSQSSFLLSQHWSNWGCWFRLAFLSVLNSMNSEGIRDASFSGGIYLPYARLKSWPANIQPCRPQQFNENINEYVYFLLHILASGLANHLGRRVVLLLLLPLSPLATLSGSITASPSSFGTGLILPLSFIDRISIVDNVVSWLVVVVRWSGLRRRWRRRR